MYSSLKQKNGLKGTVASFETHVTSGDCFGSLERSNISTLCAPASASGAGGASASTSILSLSSQFTAEEEVFLSLRVYYYTSYNILTPIILVIIY